MVKQSGLGQTLLLNDINISNDVGSFSASGMIGLDTVTGMDKEALERLPLVSDTSFSIDEGYFNPTLSHPELKSPQQNVIVSWLVSGQTQGAAVAACKTSQVNYDVSREGSGALRTKVAFEGDGTGWTWGNLLTAGLDDFTSAGQTSSHDFVAASTGGTFTVHCTEFTGTTLTVKLEDSADDAAWADVGGASSTVITAEGAASIDLATATAVDRYVRADISGTFTTATLCISFSRGTAS